MKQGPTAHNIRDDKGEIQKVYRRKSKFYKSQNRENHTKHEFQSFFASFNSQLLTSLSNKNFSIRFKRVNFFTWGKSTKIPLVTLHS